MMKRILFATLFAGLTAFSANAQQTLPSGTEIKVRTDTSIPAKPAADSRYSASVSEDVKDSSGNVVIPRGSRARLIAVPSNDGKDTNLDLRSVTVNGTPYLIDAAGSGEQRHSRRTGRKQAHRNVRGRRRGSRRIAGRTDGRRQRRSYRSSARRRRGRWNPGPYRQETGPASGNPLSYKLATMLNSRH